ncbi:trypsin-like peptidase domain-containing protein [Asticcacaulis solisilvae]|uniref:trypsin-like peptidase domain-containing protein n=1 Tax=Asticcacaulis solisilvae TaxID=1217274 RepID=UPI003FD8B304
MKLKSLTAAALLLMSASPAVAVTPPAPTVTRTQVLLRNIIRFRTGQEAAGASAFMLDVRGRTYAVTVKHMLGEDMGVVPPVKPSAVNTQLKEWLFFVPGTRSVVARARQLVTPNDNLDIDRVALSLEAGTMSPGISVLKLADSAPKVGDTLFIMGCLYSDEACHQTTYRVTYLGSDNGYMVVKPIDVIADFSGFSGAPVVDAEGQAVALGRGAIGEGTYKGDYVLYSLAGFDKDILN